MATKVYFRQALSNNYDIYSQQDNGSNDAKWKKLDGTNATWTLNQLSASPGAASINRTTNTVAGATNGVEIVSGNALHYVSPPLAADVTISGTITCNIWASENNMSANVAINVIIERIDSQGQIQETVVKTTRTTELGTTAAAENFTATPTSTAFNKGDRIRARIFGDDAGTMASGFTFTVALDGPTTGASGDTYIQFNENLTFQTTTPAGSTLYFTNTVSPVATAADDREVWTTAGSSTATATTNTTAGWLANPIQVTATAGGTVVDFWTKPLAAFTLSGPVQFTLAANESPSTLTFAAIGVEISRVDNDGSNATVWGKNHRGINGTGTADYTFWVTGDDLAVSEGQRLRLRVYIDDAGAGPLVTGRTVVFSYNGTAGGSTDSLGIFTDTLNLAPIQRSGQTQAQIKAFGVTNYGQTQADIKATSRGVGQAMAFIQNRVYAQANALITTYVFNANAEDNTLARWTLVQSTPTIQSTVVHDGNYAYKFDGGASEYLFKSWAGEQYQVGRGSFRVDTSFASTPQIFALDGPSVEAILKVDASGNLHVLLGAVDTTIGTISLGTWYNVDWRWFVGATTHQLDIKINGVEVGPVTRSGGSSGTTGYAAFGLLNPIDSTSVVYWDDILISKSSTDYPLIGVVDTFTRSVTDGLGTADSGGDWTLASGTAANGDVNGTEATFQTSASDLVYELKNVLVNNTSKGLGIRYRIKFSATPENSNALFRVRSLAGTSGTISTGRHYTFSLEYDQPNNRFNLGFSNIGTGTSLNATTTFAIDTWFIVEGTFTLTSNNLIRVRGKIYPEGSTPTAYVATTVSIDGFLPGHVFAGTYGLSSATKPLVSLDDLTILDAGWTVSGQAQATISAVGAARKHGQAQADIKATSRGLGQAQADIKATSRVVGQAQARIKQTYPVCYNYSQVVTEDAPISYWRLSETSGTLAVDARGVNDGTYHNEGSIQSVPGLITGDSNTAVDLNASGYVTATNITFTTAYTLEAWVNIDNLTVASGGIVGQWNGSGGAAIYEVANVPDPGFAAIVNGTAIGGGTTFHVFPDTRYYVAFTYDGTNGRIYVNGALIDGPTAMPAPDPTLAPFAIGIFSHLAGTTLDGVVDEAAHYGRALSTEEIVSHYEAGTTGCVGPFGQAQAYIKATRFILGQANADIKATSTNYSTPYGQAQADIKATSRGLGQANADIKQTYPLCSGISYIGENTEDSGTVVDLPVGWAAGDIALLLLGRWNSAAGITLPTGWTNIADFANNGASSRLAYRVLQSGDTTWTVGDSTDNAVMVYRGQDVIDPIGSIASAQGNSTSLNVPALTHESNGWTVVLGFSVADGTLKNKTVTGLTNRLSGDFEAAFYTGADSNVGVPSYAGTTITVSTGAWHVYTIELKAPCIGGYGQAQATIFAAATTRYAHSQAQADIKATRFVLGQAQADIKQTYTDKTGQAQTDIKQVYTDKTGQAQADIKQTSRGLGQAQADIKNTYFGLGQANADIKATSTNYTTPYGQAQADIKATSIGVGQAQAQIKNTYFGLGQAQGAISRTSFITGQCQALIYISQVSHPDSDISVTGWVRVVI